jgi:hypothetical protein
MNIVTVEFTGDPNSQELATMQALEGLLGAMGKQGKAVVRVQPKLLGCFLISTPALLNVLRSCQPLKAEITLRVFGLMPPSSQSEDTAALLETFLHSSTLEYLPPAT